MQEPTFDSTLTDSQGTEVEPVAPEDFDLDGFEEYESSLHKQAGAFWNNPEGLAVHRRFRVPQVFSWGSRDMEYSLALQLGALKESMKFKMDIPNFLEPWYGIGTVASAFGVEYVWYEGQAPAFPPPFKSAKEALSVDPTPVEKTNIGRMVLRYIEYFLEKTRGRIPMSLCDMQAPMNTTSFLIESNSFYMELLDHPQEVEQLLERIASLTIEFGKKQQEFIGDRLVLPGHGFTSSRQFSGLGMSDDCMLMLSNSAFERFELPVLAKTGIEFGGPCVHSCGNWSGKIESVKKIENLVVVDGAFSAQTDPDPNPPEAFRDALAGTGIVLNARIVGDVDVVEQVVRNLWKPGMKLIAVTYCKTGEDQARLYDRIHQLISETGVG